ncbi:unnamed protein product [Victoria cruziana]
MRGGASVIFASYAYAPSVTTVLLTRSPEMPHRNGSIDDGDKSRPLFRRCVGARVLAVCLRCCVKRPPL